MVKYSDEQLDKVFHALADTTRRSLLAQLAHGDALVTELAEPFTMSLPAISKHLGVLEKAGLIQRHKDGRIRRCQLNAKPLENASEWINFYRQFWDAQFDSLEKYLEKEVGNTSNHVKQNHKEQ